MATVQEFWEFLKGQEDAMVEELGRYTRIESCSREKHNVDRVGREVAPAFEELGFTIERIEEEECGDHLVARRSGSGKGRLLGLIHLDTIWPEGSLKQNPWRVEDGLAFGPGSLDMKGGWVVLLAALRALKEANWDGLEEVTVFMTGDEQLGSPRGRPWIEKEARNHDWTVVQEPGRAGGGVTTGRGVVGAVYYEITGKDAYATMPDQGINALTEAVHKIPLIHGLSQPDKGVFTNVGLIQGGNARQRVPDRVWMAIDVRSPNDELAEQLVAGLREIADKTFVDGTKTTMTGGITRPAFETTPRVLELLSIAQKVGKDLGYDVQGDYSMGGSDGSFTAGINATLDGLGCEGVRDKGLQENVAIESLARRGALLAGLIQELPQTLNKS